MDNEKTGVQVSIPLGGSGNTEEKLEGDAENVKVASGLVEMRCPRCGNLVEESFVMVAEGGRDLCQACKAVVLANLANMGNVKSSVATVFGPMTGAERIALERLRQFEEKDYTAKTDAKLPSGSLAAAAVCYAADEPIFVIEEHKEGFSMVDPWPWDREYDKRPYEGNVVQFKWSLEERIFLLVKAGALIAAEIDSLLYKAREGLEGLHLEGARLGPEFSGRRPLGCRPPNRRPFAEPEPGPDEIP